MIGVALFALALLRPAARLPRARAVQVPLRRSARSCCSSCRGCPGSARPSTARGCGCTSGPFAFQPGELAKIFLIVFLAAYLREKREVLAQGAAEGRRPAARDLGRLHARARLVERPRLRRSSTSGSSSRCSTSRPRGCRSCSSASASSSPAASSPTRRSRTSTSASRSGCTRGRRSKVYCPSTGGLALRQDCESYQLVKSLYSIGNGGFGGAGPRQGHVHDAPTAHALIPFVNSDFIYSALAQELGLDRRRRAAARVHAVRRARDEDRAAGRRRLLEAARGRAHVRLRASRRSSSSAASCGSSR